MLRTSVVLGAFVSCFVLAAATIGLDLAFVVITLLLAPALAAPVLSRQRRVTEQVIATHSRRPAFRRIRPDGAHQD